MSKCKILNCAKPIAARQLCAAHLKRLQRHGDPNHSAGVGRPQSAGMAAALHDLPTMGAAARARYAAAMNRKLRGEAIDGDDDVLRKTGSRNAPARSLCRQRAADIIAAERNPTAEADPVSVAQTPYDDKATLTDGSV